MAKFIRNKGLVQKITDVIEEAEEVLFILSPYYKITQEHLLSLQEASDKGVKTILIYSKADLKSQEINKLKQIKNLEVRYIENSHSKCYANEKEVIISTMNLHEFSIENNFEMGVLFGKLNDEENYNKAYSEITRIYNRSQKRTIQNLEQTLMNKVTGTIQQPVSITKKALGFVERKLDTKHHGYCIRSGKEIPFDIEKPFSKESYYQWAEYGNYDYPEKYCHFTGEKSYGETTIEYPIMRKNWDKAKRRYNL